MSKATAKQISYIRDLADKAGYTGDRGYAAANDLLGDGRGWMDREKASQLIDALKATLKIESNSAKTEAPRTGGSDIIEHKFRRADGSIGVWNEY